MAQAGSKQGNGFDFPAIMGQQANALKLPAILFGVAFLLALAGIVALAVGVAMGFATLVGPLAGGLIGFILFAIIAGGLGWYGVKLVREVL